MENIRWKSISPDIPCEPKRLYYMVYLRFNTWTVVEVEVFSVRAQHKKPGMDKHIAGYLWDRVGARIRDTTGKWQWGRSFENVWLYKTRNEADYSAEQLNIQ